MSADGIDQPRRRFIAMALGYDQPLYILACDHRGSFQKKVFGITEEPTEEETARISDAKSVIYDGMMHALGLGTARETAGILIDEQFGADIARKAKAEGIRLAMPVEKSGQDEFDFEYGEDFGAHILDFDPTFSKVLVRYNPEGDGAMNERQSERLRTLAEWLHENGRKLLFELLVPAEAHQLESVGGDAGRYDREVRAKLMLTAISELQQAGVEADIWKIEGIDARGADEAAVDHWLKAAAGVRGYAGFAIGRTIWWDALKAYVDGSLPRDAAADRIAENYLRFISVYRAG
jgi:myo-inositol catabolism protein IolC